MTSDFAHILYTVSYTIAEESPKILEWTNNNVQRYITFITPVDDSTVYCIQAYSTISDV